MSGMARAGMSSLVRALAAEMTTLTPAEIEKAVKEAGLSEEQLQITDEAMALQCQVCRGEARLAYLGHLMIENRNGLVVDTELRWHIVRSLAASDQVGEGLWDAERLRDRGGVLTRPDLHRPFRMPLVPLLRDRLIGQQAPYVGGVRRLFYNVLSDDDRMTATIQPPMLAWAWRIAVGDPHAHGHRVAVADHQLDPYAAADKLLDAIVRVP